MHDNALTRRYPESSETTLYIRHSSGGITFEEIREQVVAHFGRHANMDLMTIDSEEIQEACFGYDLHDPADFGKYFVISFD